MTDADTGYISLEDAAALLGKSERTVYRYAAEGKLEVKDTPAGKLFKRSTVEALAAELHVTPAPIQPKAELVPLSDMLAALHRKDDELALANERLQVAMRQVGRLEGQIEAQQKLLTDADMARQRVIELERENAGLRAQIEASKEPEEETPVPHPEPAPTPASEARSPLWQWVRRKLTRT